MLLKNKQWSIYETLVLKISVIFILSSYKLPRVRRSLDVYDTGDPRLLKLTDVIGWWKRKMYQSISTAILFRKKKIFGSLQLVHNYFIMWQTNYKNLGIIVFILGRENKVAMDALEVGETPQCPRIVSETWPGSMKVQRTRQLLFEGCRLI